MVEYFESVVAFYRASQDAGMWMVNNQHLKDFLESFVISKAGGSNEW